MSTAKPRTIGQKFFDVVSFILSLPMVWFRVESRNRFRLAVPIGKRNADSSAVWPDSQKLRRIAHSYKEIQVVLIVKTGGLIMLVQQISYPPLHRQAPIKIDAGAEIDRHVAGQPLSVGG